MTQTVYDTIILGSGPAGLTAAIYAARAELSALVVGGNPPGGQLMQTSEVENYPGFPQGILGPDLINNMREQALRFGAKIVDENAVELSGDANNGFTVHTDSNVFQAKTVIIATGAVARWLNIPSEERLRGRGVSACATCDGYFFKEKVVAVVGGGDSAMEEATFLTKFASKVYVLVRGSKEQMKACKTMLRKALENPKIEFLFNTEVVEVLGEQKVEGLKLSTGSTLPVDGLFLAIGHIPATNFLKDFIFLDELGYASAQKNTFSSREGVFVAGDVYDHRYRQAVTAAGYGCMAALEVEKYLQEREQA